MASSRAMNLISADDIAEELDCLICFQKKPLRLLPCGHRYCKDCLDTLGAGRLSMKCAYCAQVFKIPDDGFPVCRLSRYLSEKLTVSDKESHPEDRAKKTAHRCKACKISPVEAVCQDCRLSLCFRCTYRDKCASTERKHNAEAMEIALEQAMVKFYEWKNKTKDELVKIEQVLRSNQAEVDARKAALSGAQMVETESDELTKFLIVDQICQPLLTDEIIKHVSIHPTELRLVSMHKADSILISTHFHSVTNDLLIGCHSGSKVVRSGCLEAELLHDADSVSVSEHNGSIVFCIREGLVDDLERKVVLFDMCSKTLEPLFSFRVDSAASFHLSISEKFVVVVDRDKKGAIRLFYRSSGTLLNVNIGYPISPVNVMFLPDGSLLVSGTGTEKTLCKYKLSTDEGKAPELMWSCDLLNPSGLAVADNGMVFVSRTNNDVFTLITQQGRKLYEITAQGLPKHHEDISINKDKLAVAGWDSKLVYIFKII